MSEELHTLLSKSLLTDISQEERQQVTASLQEIYNNPQSTLDIIQFLLNEQQTLIRRAASIGFKTSLSKNWSQIKETDLREPVKDALLNIFQNEQNKLTRHNLVQWSTPIFDSDANEWISLFNFVSNLSKNKMKTDDIEFAMYLISYFVPYLAPSNIDANLQFFLELVNFAFDSQKTDLIDTACGVIAVLINNIDNTEAMQAMDDIFTKMLDFYIFTLSNSESNKNDAISITEKVAFAFEGENYPIPIEDIFSKLSEAVQYDPVLAFNPIIEFLNSCGKSFSSAFSDIIQQTLSIAVSLFVDGTLEDNEDSMYILLAVETISNKMKPRVFFPKLLEMLSEYNSTPQNTIISAMTISRVIKTSKEAIVKNISQLSKLIFATLQIDHICAKEVSLDIIKEIASLFEEGESDISSQFMKPIIELLDCDQSNVIKHSLSTLKQLLLCTDIESNLIDSLLQTLSKLLESPNNIPTYDILDVISALVFSIGDDIPPYVESLYPLIIQTASISEEEDPILKAYSIEALSNILRFSNLNDELIEQSLTLIIKSGQTADYDIRSSVMRSLSNILVKKIPQIVNFAEPIQELIGVYINDEITNDKEENEDDEDEGADVFDQFIGSQNQISCKINTYLLIKNIFKLYPQLAPEDPTQLFDFAVSNMTAFFEDLAIAATLAALYMLLAVPKSLDPTQFFEKLTENFDNIGASLVSQTFKVVARFLENDVPIPKEILIFAIEKGKLALDDKLDCQEEDVVTDNSRLTLSMQVNRFFAEVATKSPEDFPINIYIDYENQIGQNSDEFEISQCIGVLRQLYINSGEGKSIVLASIQKKKIISSFFSTLNICDFTVLPEPLIALKNVLERDSDKILPKMQSVLEFIANLFSSENEGQMHYWSTMTTAVSFLCSFMKLSLDSFDLKSWLPHMLHVLPVKGDEMEAENIYANLVWLIELPNVGNDVLNEFGPEFIRIFAQTFGMKEKVINSLKLSSETKQKMAKILINLLQNAEGAAEIYEQVFTDEQQAKERCQKYLESI